MSGWRLRKLFDVTNLALNVLSWPLTIKLQYIKYKRTFSWTVFFFLKKLIYQKFLLWDAYREMICGRIREGPGTLLWVTLLPLLLSVLSNSQRNCYVMKKEAGHVCWCQTVSFYKLDLCKQYILGRSWCNGRQVNSQWYSLVPKHISDLLTWLVCALMTTEVHRWGLAGYSKSQFMTMDNWAFTLRSPLY